MRAMVTGLLCLAFSSSPLLAENPPGRDARDTIVGTAMLCVRRAAIRFEPSGETPQSIADAAMWACSSERIALGNYDIQHPSLVAGAVDMESNYRFVAVAQVVGVRLCKRSRDCAYASALSQH